MPTAQDERGALYRNYADWKQWAGTAEGGPDTARRSHAFQIECQRAGLPENANVLELGFGNGEFLDWCHEAGHRVCGIELIPELVDRAAAKGYRVVLCDGTPPPFDDGQTFDLIVAFDVFEHLSAADLSTWLAWLAPRLRPEGRILARFPNGGSPFGRLYQSGDLTHRLSLSVPSMEQLARMAGLRLEGAYNSARHLSGGGRSWLTKRLAYAIRDLIEAGVGYVYFGRYVPLDPNLTVVLARA